MSVNTLITGQMEPEPVTVVHSPGADMDALQQFCYIPASSTPLDHTLQDCEGCKCHSCDLATSCGDNANQSCSCYAECLRALQALKAQGRAAGLVVMLECGPACSCSTACPARPTQQGVRLKLALFWCNRKGWCVKAMQAIPQGTHVCEYAGEYVSGSEAEQRLAVYDREDRGHALLVVRVQLPSRTSCIKCCIDATRTGNVARYINHSCDGGNLEPVVVSSKGSLLPRVALFAARDIQEGEELSFSYACSSSTETAAAATTAPAAAAAAEGAQQATAQAADVFGSIGGGLTAAAVAQQWPVRSSRRCWCGTRACTGFLPTVA